MGTISLTNPVAATVITAGLHATNYTTLQTVINGNLDNNNWAAGAIFAPSKFTQEAAARQDGMVWNGTIWIPRAVANVYDRATTTVDVQTSAAETAIYSKSIAANDMGNSKMLRLTLLGDYLHNNVAADTILPRIKFGGNTFWGNASNLGNAIGAARHPWHLYLHIANLGATNSQMVLGQFGPIEFANAAAPSAGIGQGLATTAPLGSDTGIATLGTIDTTTAQTLEVSVQWSASSANNSWRMRYGVLEIV
jgi:hypothetical protein